MFIKTKKLITLTSMLLFSASITLANSQQHSTRKSYTSCINLTTQLEKRTTSANIPQVSDQLSFKKAETKKSEKYLSLYNQNKHSIMLVQTPSSHGLNIKNTKTMSNIKLPKHWENIEHFIINDNYLFISAQEKKETIILIYTIDKNKILPLKTFQVSGNIKRIHQSKENLFFLLEKKLQKADIMNIIKQQGENPHLLPKITSSTSYRLKPQLLDQAQCKKIDYHFSKNNQASFFTLINLQTNALEQMPKINYFLGNIDEASFAQDYLYLLSTNPKENHIQIARFFREPKLAREKSEILTGNLLAENAVETEKNSLKILIQNSNNYILSKRENEKITQIPLEKSSEKSDYKKIIW